MAERDVAYICPYCGKEVDLVHDKLIECVNKVRVKGKNTGSKKKSYYAHKGCAFHRVNSKKKGVAI